MLQQPADRLWINREYPKVVLSNIESVDRYACGDGASRSQIIDECVRDYHALQLRDR